MTMQEYEKRYETIDRIFLYSCLILDVLLAFLMQGTHWPGWVSSGMGWLLMGCAFFYLKKTRRLTVGLIPVSLFSLGLCALGVLFQGLVSWLAIVLSVLVMGIGILFLWFLPYFTRMGNVKFDPVSPENGDTILLLGTAVEHGRPSYELSLRCHAAADLLKKQAGMHIIVSGGKVSDPLVSEAQVMKDELMRHGISASRITMEEDSLTTVDNLKKTAALLKKENFRGKLYLATSDYHLYRALHDAQDAGVKVSPLAVPMPIGMREVLWCREALVLKHYHL